MKANNVRFSARLGLLLAAFVALCVVAIPASARPSLKGTFTLTHEARWGKATLPAGEYSLEVDQTTQMLLIRDARSNKPIALEVYTLYRTDDNARNRDSKLVIAVRANERVVCSAWLAGLGEVLHSAPHFGGATLEEVVVVRNAPVTGM
jgi:hypothetical protein